MNQSNYNLLWRCIACAETVINLSKQEVEKRRQPTDWKYEYELAHANGILDRLRQISNEVRQSKMTLDEMPFAHIELLEAALFRVIMYGEFRAEIEIAPIFQNYVLFTEMRLGLERRHLGDAA